MILFFSRYILLSRLKNFLSFERFAKMATKDSPCTNNKRKYTDKPDVPDKKKSHELHEIFSSYCNNHNKYLGPGKCRDCKMGLSPKKHKGTNIPHAKRLELDISLDPSVPLEVLDEFELRLFFIILQSKC